MTIQISLEEGPQLFNLFILICRRLSQSGLKWRHMHCRRRLFSTCTSRGHGHRRGQVVRGRQLRFWDLSVTRVRWLFSPSQVPTCTDVMWN